MLDTRLQSLIGQNKRGPNCWNATILYFDPTEEVVYVSDFIMERWLKLNTWRIEQDAIQSGDILVLRSMSRDINRFSLIHTAVLIDKDTMSFFHKGGVNEGWEIVTMEQLTGIYTQTMFHWHRAGSVISKV
jgi:hypothetical protein